MYIYVNIKHQLFGKFYSKRHVLITKLKDPANNWRFSKSFSKEIVVLNFFLNF